MSLRDQIPLRVKKTVREIYEWPQRLVLDPFVYLLQRRLSDMPLVRGRRSRLFVGKGAFLSNTLFNTVSGTISIGDYAYFGHNCMVLTGTHEQLPPGPDGEYIGRSDYTPQSGRDIIIGKRCWIASGAIVLGPVKIGDGAVIGAGAVLRTDVPSGAFAAGVPARVIQRKIGAGGDSNSSR